MYILQIHIMQFMSEKKMKRTKFIYSEKATKFYEISTLLLTTVHTVKCKVEISQNFVAFSEYMNFTVRVHVFHYSCIIQPLFLQKTKHLHPHLGIWIWAAMY